MQEVLRSNDAVLLGYAQTVLSDAGLHPVIFDTHASIMDGSVLAVQRRLMVPDDEKPQAMDIIMPLKADYDAGG